MIKRELIESREYQIKIAENASKKNTLVVLPTGLGKSLIALLVAEKRLKEFPESKIIITAPTRPLAAQHKKLFEELTNLPKEKIGLVTGKIRREERKNIYDKCLVITATPQCLKNDLNSGILSLRDFSFLIVDEAHRAVKNYPYPIIAKKFMIQSKNPLILALTASPGATQERIEEICKNLFIKNVEIRSEKDEDVRKYVKKVELEWIYVDLPEEQNKIKEIFSKILDELIEWLKVHGYITRKRLTKKQILSLQNRLMEQLEKTKNKRIFSALTKIAMILKIEHALELAETQDISALKQYLEKLFKSKKRVDRILHKNEGIKRIKLLIEQIKEREHPKIKKTIEIIKEILSRKSEAKIIVFANYRNTVENICKKLRENSISANILIGQARKGKKGLSQKEQIEILKRFSNAEFNVLCGTSITEEGLDIPQVDYIIFYEPVPSEIRTIQRRGRTGRTAPGKVIFLITKNTRDEAYYWSAFRKEKKMKKILELMQPRKILETTR